MTHYAQDLLDIEASLKAELDAVNKEIEPLKRRASEIDAKIEANRTAYVSARFDGRTNEELLGDPQLLKELFDINWSNGYGNTKTMKICKDLFASFHPNFMSEHQTPPGGNGYTDVYQSLMFYIKEGDDLDVLEENLAKLANILLAAAGQETITISILDKYSGDRPSVEMLYTSPDKVELKVSRYGEPYSFTLNEAVKYLKKNNPYS